MCQQNPGGWEFKHHVALFGNGRNLRERETETEKEKGNWVQGKGGRGKRRQRAAWRTPTNGTKMWWQTGWAQADGRTLIQNEDSFLAEAKKRRCKKVKT